MGDERYYTDERVGCIAVMDRTKIDHDYNGLHSDSPGVVVYWPGAKEDDGTWCVPAAFCKAASMTRDELNKS